MISGTLSPGMLRVVPLCGFRDFARFVTACLIAFAATGSQSLV